MSNKNQVFRLKIIDELLQRNKWVKTSRIIEVIEDKMQETVKERTIQKDMNDLKYDTRLGYNAPIEYNHKEKAYMYTDRNYSINNFSLTAAEIDALKFYAECLQAFSGYKIFDSFTSGINKVIKGVKFKNKLKPSTDPKTILQTDSLVTFEGHEYIERLVYAIDNRYPIQLTYRAYTADQPEKRSLLPIYLKEYRNRWYLLAFKFEEQKIKTYSLDRVKGLRVVEKRSDVNVDFDPAYYFKHSFGITTPDVAVEKVVLGFTNKEVAWVKSLPIHPTQQEEKSIEGYYTISIEVTVSYELYEYILGKTPEIKVFAPESLAKEVGERLEKGRKIYS
jgi:predicted DNA-binding transcriptional regulator YafY